MSNHLILALEAFAALATGASRDGAIMWCHPAGAPSSTMNNYLRSTTTRRLAPSGFTANTLDPRLSIQPPGRGQVPPLAVLRRLRVGAAGAGAGAGARVQ
jgi:hypothetical protein